MRFSQLFHLTYLFDSTYRFKLNSPYKVLGLPNLKIVSLYKSQLENLVRVKSFVVPYSSSVFFSSALFGFEQLSSASNIKLGSNFINTPSLYIIKLKIKNTPYLLKIPKRKVGKNLSRIFFYPNFLSRSVIREMEQLG